MPFNPANPYEYLMSGQGRRSFNSMPDTKQAAFGYAFNPFFDNGNGISGQFQPLTTNGQGALRVDVGSGISVTLTGTSVTVDDVAVTGGNINVIGFNTLTGQVAQLQNAVNTLTGTVTSKWQKVSTTGYTNMFAPITGRCLINKVNGYSKTPLAPGFLQFFDGNTGTVPVQAMAVQSGMNYFYEWSDQGVEFTNGFTAANASDPIAVGTGMADFIMTVVYKML